MKTGSVLVVALVMQAAFVYASPTQTRVSGRATAKRLAPAVTVGSFRIQPLTPKFGDGSVMLGQIERSQFSSFTHGEI